MSGEDEDEAAVRPSKSARKREREVVQALARRLARLPDARLAALPLEPEAREALALARRLERQAFERQVRYAAQRLARGDWQAIGAALDALERPRRDAVRAFHDVERWRDRLIAGDEALLAELAARYPGFDRAQAGRLAQEAAAGEGSDRRPAAARRLFRYLAALREGEEGGER